MPIFNWKLTNRYQTICALSTFMTLERFESNKHILRYCNLCYKTRDFNLFRISKSIIEYLCSWYFPSILGHNRYLFVLFCLSRFSYESSFQHFGLVSKLNILYENVTYYTTKDSKSLNYSKLRSGYVKIMGLLTFHE